ncbi:MAG: sugar ABC transporter permease [Anaerolineaceae bacterium]|nr:MAG: sugar ABC transporter permease [Anaerolineaceae bacterium]
MAALRRKKKPKTKRTVPLIMRQGTVTPWLFVIPALIIIFIYIAYPTLYTGYLSLRNSDSSEWATAACREGETCWGVFENYRYALTSDVMLKSFRNNILWLVIMVPGVTAMGLLFAVLVDRVRYEALAKALIFMPMAISFVGAGVIWGFVYDFPVNPDNPNAPIIGILNAALVSLGQKPVPWLSSPPLINNLALIVVGIWLYTGFGMTILSAAIKGVPDELLEAARIDGASEWMVFWRIMVPLILPTITVVLTTMTIFTLKLFDIIYVMTGGNFDSNVVAVRMYQEMYINFEAGRSAAIAVVLLILIIPVLIYNIRRFQEQEAIR